MAHFEIICAMFPNEISTRGKFNRKTLLLNVTNKYLYLSIRTDQIDYPQIRAVKEETKIQYPVPRKTEEKLIIPRSQPPR